MTDIKVGLAGDWHGELAWAFRMLKVFRDAGISTIFHAGDFGVWQDNGGRKYRFRVNKELAAYDQHLLVTLGNHENYEMVSHFEEVTEGEWKGFLVDPTQPRILYFQRGQTLTLNGVNFISLGGANSIDRFSRTEHINWWAGEQIGLADMYRTQENALALEGGVDVFLAHDVFAGANLFENHHENHADYQAWTDEALEFAQRSRDALRLVAEVVKPRIWIHGHYHRKMVLDTTLADWDGNQFEIRSYCLDKDWTGDNIATLNLPSLEVEWLSYKI